MGIFPSVTCPTQHSESPSGCGGHGGDEGQAGQAPGNVALAPALEHRDESNEEENNGHDAKGFKPHAILLLKACHRN